MNILFPLLFVDSIFFLYIFVLGGTEHAVFATPSPTSSNEIRGVSSSNRGNILMNLLEEDENMEQHAVAVVANVTDVPPTPIFSYFHDGDVIALNFSKNMYIYRCEDCNKKLVDTINVSPVVYNTSDLCHVTEEGGKVTQNSLWRVEHVAEGRMIRLVGDNGRYLRRVEGSESTLLAGYVRAQLLSVDAVSSRSNATVWTVMPSAGRRFSLEADNGRVLAYMSHELCRAIGGNCLAVVPPDTATNPSILLTATVYDTNARETVGISSVLFSGGVAPFGNGDYVSFEMTNFATETSSDTFWSTGSYKKMDKALHWISDVKMDPVIATHLNDVYKQRNVSGVMAFGQHDPFYRQLFQAEFLGDVRNGIVRFRAVNGAYLGYAVTDDRNCIAGICPWPANRVPLRIIYSTVENGTKFTLDAAGRVKPVDLQGGAYTFAATRTTKVNKLPFATVFLTRVKRYGRYSLPIIENETNGYRALDVVAKKVDTTAWEEALVDYGQSADASASA